MTNRRVIFVLLGGILAAALALWGLAVRTAAVASLRTRAALFEGTPADVDGLEIEAAGLHVVLERRAAGWRLVSPFPAEVDPAVVARLIDAFALGPIGDTLSYAEVRGLERSLADFGLAPARVSVVLRSGRREDRVYLGGPTPTRAEVYARVNRLENVFTVPSNVVAVVPASLDGFRRSALLPFARDDISGLDIRVPGSPFLKLARSSSDWRLVQPEAASAAATAVAALADRLAAARVAAYVWPTATSSIDVREDERVRTARLAPYGLDVEAGVAVTVHGPGSAAEQIVFGAPAPGGTNLVYALVQDGTAIVTVDGALAERCHVGESVFRDRRVFSALSAARVRSVSLTTPEAVYVVVQSSNRLWRLETPVDAPADTAAVASLIDRLLRLQTSDLATNAASAVRVALAVDAPTATNVPSVLVPAAALGGVPALAGLRSKTLLAIGSSTLRRISVTDAAGRATIVAYDAARAAWAVPAAPAAAAVDAASGRALRSVKGTVRAENVARLVAALADVEATSIETVSAAPEDLRRCGLDHPAFTVAVDVDAADAVRKNILLGGPSAGGGRYATVGGADAIFIVSRATVAALTLPLVE